MPNFTITVAAQQAVCQDFEIEAETREEAEEKALAEAREQEFGWEGQDHFDDHQVTLVEQEQEREDEE